MTRTEPRHLEKYPPLETVRMLLVPLSLEQMQMQMEDYGGLERSLGARVTGNRLEREMRPVVARSIAYMGQEPAEAIWNTFWAAILKGEDILVGGIGFKGPANGAGEVELGYGFDAPYRNRGLATEAVNGLTAWAFDQIGVSSVTVETYYTNIASARVLQKAGFLLYAASNHFLYWRRNQSKSPARAAMPGKRDGCDELYDLVVVVEETDDHCASAMQVGDRFFLRSSNFSLPDGGHFCVYALQSVLPLLSGRQLPSNPINRRDTDRIGVCSNPDCKVKMRVERLVCV